MKFSLDLGEPLGDEVRRIASGRLTAAADLLRSRPEGLDAAIHDARRNIKQCRALYRMVASEAKAFRKAENARLSGIGRELSAMRDAKALVEVALYLKQEIPTKANALLMERLTRRLEHRRAASPRGAAGDVLDSAIDALAEAAMAAGTLALPTARRKSAAALARGWGRTGREIREALDATAGGDDEAFHDLRKRMQDRWMQAGLLKGLWPTAMVSIQRQAKYLSDLLGHAQDLTMLLDTISGDADLIGDSVESEAIRETILAQRMQLQERCRALARDLSGRSRPRDRAMIERLLRER